MLTPSVNIVQSSFAEDQQGEISGLSRSVSNLGSCLGTAIAGTILVARGTGLEQPSALPATASYVALIAPVRSPASNDGQRTT
jgi:predicted MFS family arabinose efflux permease